MNYTPIAKKKIDLDPETNIDRWIYVWKLSIDAKSETVSVVFDVVMVVNGKVVGLIRTGEYRRWNSPLYKKFEILRNSPVGGAITGIIDTDLDEIQSIDTIDDDLKQLDVDPN